MTREEAINELQNNKQDYTYIMTDDAIDMAIKALEQEPKILDTLDFAIDASNGDTNYFVGFRNGLRYSKSLIDGKEPQFESCAEQEPCEECSRANKPNPYYDCVSRQNAIDVMWQELDEDIARKVRDILETQPSITPKPKMGHWKQYGYSWEDKFKCSECGKEQPKILCGERIIGHWSDYCPNCGADMRESEDT